MELTKNFIIIIIPLAITIGINICVAIYGWGLSPKSWFWIIVMPIIGGIIVQMMVKLNGNTK